MRARREGIVDIVDDEFKLWRSLGEDSDPTLGTGVYPIRLPFSLLPNWAPSKLGRPNWDGI